MASPSAGSHTGAFRSSLGSGGSCCCRAWRAWHASRGSKSCELPSMQSDTVERTAGGNPSLGLPCTRGLLERGGIVSVSSRRHHGQPNTESTRGRNGQWTRTAPERTPLEKGRRAPLPLRLYAAVRTLPSPCLEDVSRDRPGDRVLSSRFSLQTGDFWRGMTTMTTPPFVRIRARRKGSFRNGCHRRHGCHRCHPPAGARRPRSCYGAGVARASATPARRALV